MTSTIFQPATDLEIAECFDLFKVLRPHLEREDFVERVRRQQGQGYVMLAVRIEDRVKSAAGFRVLDFLAWGKVLYVDDLITYPDAKRRGYAGQLLDWMIERARALHCDAVHLDSGYARHDAHRLYLRKGFRLNAHHFAMELRSGE
jgi:GNAT superfamily N-acetyltransferase